MRNLRMGVEKVFNTAAAGPLLSPATVLAALAAVYGGLGALRADLYRAGILSCRRLPFPVISVGNLTVGGTGKTPLTMDLAARLKAMGRRVCVLSRGYRAKAERRGAVVSDGRSILVSVAEAGDEPYLIARRLPGVPVVVGKDRWASGMLASERFGSRVFVLDDGYQHLRLARDLNLLLLDFHDPLANGWILPRGRLRESPRAARRSDALVFVSRGRGGEGTRPHPALAAGRPCLTVDLKPFAAAVIGPGNQRLPEASVPGYLAGRRCAVFAGIADNSRFFNDVAALGAQVVARCGFGDHHPYRPADLERVMAAARRTGAECLITTAKDQVRLEGAGSLDLPLVVIDLKVVWDDDGEQIQALLKRVSGHPPASLHT